MNQKYSLADIFPAGTAYVERNLAEINAMIDRRVANDNKPKPLSLPNEVRRDLRAASKDFFKPSPFVWRDPKTIPPRDWIYGRHLLRRHVSATIASGAVGKTSLKIVEALALATGRNLLGYDVPRTARVWLFNLEDDRDEIDRRVIAAMIHYRITPEDIAGRLFIEGETPLIITSTDRQGTKIRQPVVDGLVEAIKDRAIDVLIVDPFVSSHDAPESDNGAIDKIVKHGWVKIARESGCAIDIAHHTTKADASSGIATAMSARGAGSFIAACRSVQVLNPMLPEEATKAGLASHVGYFSCYGDKQNLTPKTSVRDWYKMESVDLGNAGEGNLAFMRSDNIGVVSRWNWPTDNSFVEDVTADQLRAIKNLLKIGEHRKDVQSNDWAGYAVGKILDLGVTKETMIVQDRQRIKRMLEAWEQDGVLKERISKVDGHRRMFLTVP